MNAKLFVQYFRQVTKQNLCTQQYHKWVRCSVPCYLPNLFRGLNSYLFWERNSAQELFQRSTYPPVDCILLNLLSRTTRIIFPRLLNPKMLALNNCTSESYSVWQYWLLISRLTKHKAFEQYIYHHTFFFSLQVLKPRCKSPLRICIGSKSAWCGVVVVDRTELWPKVLLYNLFCKTERAAHPNTDTRAPDIYNNFTPFVGPKDTY